MSEDIPALGVPELLRWLLRWRKRYQVINNSMRPLLQPGDEVLVDPDAYRQRLPSPGEIVVAWHPDKPGQKIIKRVTAQSGNGLTLRGDNAAESTDLYEVSPSLVLGRVACRFGLRPDRRQ